MPRKDGRPERRATLAVRYGAFALRPPSTHPRRQELATLPLRTVLVEEVNAPAGVKPLQWLLLTTLPIDSFADAKRLVRWYTYRWRIERYHFTLKSGCRLEQLRLETAERLRRALALYAMVAARLLHLTYLARQEPEASCEPAVSAEEWEDPVASFPARAGAAVATADLAAGDALDRPAGRVPGAQRGRGARRESAVARPAATGSHAEHGRPELQVKRYFYDDKTSFSPTGRSVVIGPVGAGRRPRRPQRTGDQSGRGQSRRRAWCRSRRRAARTWCALQPAAA